MEESLQYNVVLVHSGSELLLGNGQESDIASREWGGAKGGGGQGIVENIWNFLVGSVEDLQLLHKHHGEGEVETDKGIGVEWVWGSNEG